MPHDSVSQSMHYMYELLNPSSSWPSLRRGDLLPTPSSSCSTGTSATNHKLGSPCTRQFLPLSLHIRLRWRVTYRSLIAGSFCNCERSGIPPPFCICSAMFRIFGFCINRSRPPFAIICWALVSGQYRPSCLKDAIEG